MDLLELVIVAVAMAVVLPLEYIRWRRVEDAQPTQPAFGFRVSMAALQTSPQHFVDRLRGKVVGITILEKPFGDPTSYLVDTHAVDHELESGALAGVEARAQWAAQLLGVEVHRVSNPEFGGLG